MTKDELNHRRSLNIQIARFIGWKFRKTGFWERILSLSSVITTSPSGEEYCGFVPDFYCDLNALHDAENFLIDTGLWGDYVKDLKQRCGEKYAHAGAFDRASSLLNIVWREEGNQLNRA